MAIYGGVGVRAGDSLLAPVSSFLRPSAKKDHFLAMNAERPCSGQVHHQFKYRLAKYLNNVDQLRTGCRIKDKLDLQGCMGAQYL